jgi:hypothetical protein
VALTRVDEDMYLYTVKIPVHLVLSDQVNTASVSAAMTKMVPKIKTLILLPVMQVKQEIISV